MGVAVKKLIEHGMQAGDTPVFKVSFMSGVLKFELSNQVLVMPAEGKDWPDTYVCLSKGLVNISKRTAAEGVWLGIWQSRLTIGRVQLSIEPPLMAG